MRQSLEVEVLKIASLAASGESEDHGAMDVAGFSMSGTRDPWGRASDVDIHAKHRPVWVVAAEPPSTLRAASCAGGTRFACPKSQYSWPGNLRELGNYVPQKP